jgi:hypothetical protein
MEYDLSLFSYLPLVIPAKAGIHRVNSSRYPGDETIIPAKAITNENDNITNKLSMDSCLRRNDSIGVSDNCDFIYYQTSLTQGITHV